MVSSGPGLMVQLERTLGRFMSSMNARAVVSLAVKRAGIRQERLDSTGLTERLANELVMSSRLYVRDPQRAAELSRALRGGDEKGSAQSASQILEIREEVDIVRARGAAKAAAERLGFDHLDQIRISTAVSELARNIYRYAGHGEIHVRPEAGVRSRLEIVAEDRGPGISNLDEILAGRYVSKTGLGRGLYGCKAMMDEFEVSSRVGHGTRVRMAKVVSA